MSLLTSVFLVLDNQATQFISRGKVSFLSRHDFKILVKTRGGNTFSTLASSRNIKQAYFFD